MKSFSKHSMKVDLIERTFLPLFLGMALASAMGSVQAQNAPEQSAPVQMEHMRPAIMEDGFWGGPHSKEQLDRMWAKKVERFEHRQAEFKARLKITPAQESAWSQFVQAIRPPQARPQLEMDRDQMRSLKQLSAPQRMEKMLTIHDQVQAQISQKMHEHLDAVKALYPQLSAEQQKEFDRFTLRHNRMHWGRAKGD